MCGIFGRFAWNGSAADIDVLSGLVDELTHRGPDAGGYWTEGPFYLGHRRLAILDLTEAGRQPMASPGGRYVVTFNGEIYNFLELARELETLGYAFHSRSDTEILVAGWQEWGEGVVSKLTGMFAFAIADRQRHELFLARDRFGEKPLFYRESNGEVIFASELRAISGYVSASHREVDLDALAGYLCLNYVPGRRSLLQGVSRLAPGSVRHYRADGTIAERSYWQPHAETSDLARRGSLDDVLKELRNRLDRAVGLALRSDVPVALFLSGGIDSSLVAESAVRQGTLRSAFCLDVTEASFSEWDNAKFVADRLGLELVRVSLRETALDDFFDVVGHADDPLADSSALAVWCLAQATAQQYKVAVSGDGGDELFGGYLTYKASALHRSVTTRLGRLPRQWLASRSPPGRANETKVSTGYKLLRFLRAADLPVSQAHFSWNGAWMPEQAAALVGSADARAACLGALARLAASHRLTARPRLTELQLTDAAEYLPNDILAKVDRMTMAHSLESRAPLLNQELAELAFATTARFEQTPLQKPKRLLRLLADRAFGPRVSRAKKQGFSIPVHSWLRGRGRPMVEDLLSRRSLARLPFLDADEVSRVKDRFLQDGEPLGFEMWGLAVLVAWHRTRVVSSPITRRQGTNLFRVELSPLNPR